MESAPYLYSLLPSLHRKPLGMINETPPFFCFSDAARGILAPPPGITPVSPAVEAQSLNH